MHINHVGSIALLTKLINFSISTFTIPNEWKVGTINNHWSNQTSRPANSYRSVSLLSSITKPIESLLHPQLQKLQHGFRKHHGTTKHPAAYTTEYHRTVVVALDFSRMFDTVNHNVLLSKMWQSSWLNHIKRWITNYLKNRQRWHHHYSVWPECWYTD